MTINPSGSSETTVTLVPTGMATDPIFFPFMRSSFWQTLVKVPTAPFKETGVGVGVGVGVGIGIGVGVAGDAVGVDVGKGVGVGVDSGVGVGIAKGTASP